MFPLETPVDEPKRIEALKRYDLLDTPPDGNFDRITALAAAIFKVPVSIISLVDTDRIWFKSHYGLSVSQIDREPGLCASAILSSDTYVIDDASLDARSLANPLVAGEFGLRFYAAVPLQTSDNHNLGTLCIIDKQPRRFTSEENALLRQLAGIVMDEMELRLALRNTVSTIKNLSSDISAHLNDTIKKMATTRVEDLKEEVLSYLDASRMFMKNIENRVNQL
jgi:GAF domain-containing protein